MWIIKNKTGGIVLIEDLTLSFKPHQEYDIDTFGRENAQRSTQLSLFLNNNILETLHKDEQIKQELAPAPTPVSAPAVSQEDLNAMIQQSVSSLFSSLSEGLSNEIANSLTDVVRRNLQENSSYAEIEAEETDFEDISVQQAQADLLRSRENLSSSFQSIGDKKEIDSPDDIAGQLRKLKRKGI